MQSIVNISVLGLLEILQQNERFWVRDLILSSADVYTQDALFRKGTSQVALKCNFNSRALNNASTLSFKDCGPTDPCVKSELLRRSCSLCGPLVELWGTRQLGSVLWPKCMFCFVLFFTYYFSTMLLSSRNKVKAGREIPLSYYVCIFIVRGDGKKISIYLLIKIIERNTMKIIDLGCQEPRIFEKVINKLTSGKSCDNVGREGIPHPQLWSIRSCRQSSSENLSSLRPPGHILTSLAANHA